MRIINTIAMLLVFQCSIAQLSSDDIAAAIRDNNLGVVSTAIKQSDINAPFTEGEHTLLCFAVKIGNESMVKYLIKRGAGINVMSNQKTPLMYAAKYGMVDCAKALIEAGADPEFKNKKGRIAADYARKYQQDEMEALFKESAEADSDDED